MRPILLILCLMLHFSCERKDLPTPSDAMYFPNNNANWEILSIKDLGWNQTAVEPLKNFLKTSNTKAFIILVDGRIVMEEYFDGHTAKDTWEWNSAGKTLVATATGIAQQEGLLAIDQKASDYLGTGWSSMPLEKENLISVRNLLTMTAGNDDSKQLVIKSNLTYVADAGTRWAYSNIFQKLIDVVEKASKEPFETYFNDRLKNKIGMDGHWNFGLIFTIYHSTARSMARFGHLALHKGKWKEEQVVAEKFFDESTNTSQNINPSYGYLWWLNGKDKFMLPGDQTVYNSTLVPNAPKDMFAGMGALDQRVYVIPSKKMVVVRMGEAANKANPNFAVSGFDNALWGQISSLYQ